MNWRESLLTAINQGTYAKGAKASSAGDDTELLHLLHTDNSEPQTLGVPDSVPSRTIGRGLDPPQQPKSLEDVLKGLAIELWSNAAGCLFIVADEEDALRLGESRGSVYTADELRKVVQIEDPATVLEIHQWKLKFNASLRECQDRKQTEGHGK